MKRPGISSVKCPERDSKASNIVLHPCFSEVTARSWLRERGIEATLQDILKDIDNQIAEEEL